MSRARRRGIVAAAAFIVLSGTRKRKRRYWMRSFLKQRSNYSVEDMLSDLRKDDTDPVTNEETINGWFKNYTRISAEDFDKLAEAITPYCQKQDTSFRDAVSVRAQLAVTLRFLATGDSFSSIHYDTHISISKCRNREM